MVHKTDNTVRHDWTKEEVATTYNLPLVDLIYQAMTIHREYFDPQEMQQCHILSIKTGGCSENCSYCAQSAHNKTTVKPQKLMKVDAVLVKAKEAKTAGHTRFCMGAAWSRVRDSRDFDQVLEMVRQIRLLGLEVCCTLGMVNEDQAKKLKEAGLTAYNHNLDTGRNHYNKIVTTRTYEDRLNTIANLNKAGVSVCCGGILGLGETEDDRIDLLHTLATLPVHPESVPVNALIPIKGTPLQDQSPVDVWEIVRTIATARILIPKAMVRLAGGRVSLSAAEQSLCFLAGANSIFVGKKILTTPNNDKDEDSALFELLGLKGRPPHKS